VNRVVAPEELMPAALQLAAQMADIEGRHAGHLQGHDRRRLCARLGEAWT
jgi:hypothetical protein